MTELIHTRCPIDGTDDADEEVYPANFDADALLSAHFSARRRPDRIHYRMVRNRRTGCLRADPVLPPDVVARLYDESEFTYGELAPFVAATYGRYLRRALPLLPDRRGALEVGCGNGFFLPELAASGFGLVRGVEPSRDAGANASPDVAPLIVSAMLAPGLFPRDSFSLICGFQVLDHLLDPNETLAACRSMLCEGGVMYWICHDQGAPLQRLLGRRSPIVDIEHPVLYNRRTVRLLFEKHGFEVCEVFGVTNRYPLDYWMHLAPAPGAVRRFAQSAARLLRVTSLPVPARLGNMGILARKRAR